MLLYDLKKAFNQLELSESDQSKLLFYWTNNASKGDFSPVMYRNVRLSFGLRCSLFLLMISLYYILMINTDDDSSELKDLKKLMYGLIYMDNGAITMNDKDYLVWAQSLLREIFVPYQYKVQQVFSNLHSLPNSDRD